MKLHKIRNTELSICAAEQQVAYNYAFNLYTTMMDTEAAAEHIKKFYAGNYDISAIVQAFKNGFENYRAAEYHILTNCDDIGAMFPLNV